MLILPVVKCRTRTEVPVVAHQVAQGRDDQVGVVVEVVGKGYIGHDLSVHVRGRQVERKGEHVLVDVIEHRAAVRVADYTIPEELGEIVK